MKRSSSPRRSVLALAIGGLIFTSLACEKLESDQRQADNKVNESLKKSAANRRTPTTQSLTQAITELNTAVATSKGGSLASKIRANAALAQAEFEAGDRILRDLSALNPQVSQAMWEIAQTAAQVRRANEMVASLAATNPDPTLKAIGEKKAAMQNAGTDAARRIGELQGEIDKVKGQVTQLTQQRDAATTEADSLADKASKADLKDADALLDQSGEARRKAGNLGHEIDKVAAAMMPLERDLAVEQGKKKAADEAIAALDEQATTVNKDWAVRQGLAGQQKTKAGELGQELAAKAKRLDDLTRRADDLRKAALEQFDRSSRHSAAASNEAKTYGVDLGKWSGDHPTAPERKAWDQMKITYSPQVFKLSEAEADSVIGSIHSAHAAQLDARQKLATSVEKDLQPAGIPMPPGIAPAAADAATRATADANTAYTSAADKFMTVYTGLASPSLRDVKDLARLDRMLSLYGQYLNGDEKKLADAQTEFKELFQERKDDPLIKLLPPKLTGGASAPAPNTGTRS
jgi:hypothetical protein